jgi:hypothetical protein
MAQDGLRAPCWGAGLARLGRPARKKRREGGAGWGGPRAGEGSQVGQPREEMEGMGPFIFLYFLLLFLFSILCYFLLNSNSNTNLRTT